jgi:hypothetical protein
MPQAVSASDHAVEAHRPTRPAGRAVGVAAGLVIGLLAGIVFDAAAWLYAFAATLNGGSSINIPFIVTTYSSGEDVGARSGFGVLLLPLALAVLGALVGLLVVGASRRRRP